MSQGGHSEPLLQLALFYQSTPSCLKVIGWGGWVGGGWWVAHVILVSALGPNPSFFLFLGTFIQLGGLLGQGLGLGLGPGLDNLKDSVQFEFGTVIGLLKREMESGPITNLYINFIRSQQLATGCKQTAH